MKILIGADIVPTPSNMAAFEAGKTEELVDSELKMLLDSADYRIFNLEVPLTDKQTPIVKAGPNLIASTKSAKGIADLGIDFVTIANNHILDQDVQGLHSTEKVLEEYGIQYAGAGDTLEEVKYSHIFKLGEKKICIYCCAEHEFSIASKDRPGVNPFDPLESLDHVTQLREECDYLIVLYHGGKEEYRYPAPYLQKVCRKLVDKGADLVVCQHSHCIGCQEQWNHGRIVYGQGNFLFDDDDNEYWKTSLLLSIEMNGDKTEINEIPLCKEGSSVRLASADEQKTILNGFRSRSEEILDEALVNKFYHELSEKMQPYYLKSFCGISNENLFFRVLDKLTGRKWSRLYFKHKFNTRQRAGLCNTLECEAHRELLTFSLDDSWK